MPISIDGSGTISGLAAGWLPDATVQAADLNGGTPAAGLILSATSGSAMAWRDALVLDVAKASTSGTSVDFTGIPAWVHRITVMFRSVSTSGTSPVLVRLGSGTILTSGYTADATICGNATTTASQTAGFNVTQSGAATDAYSGAVTLCNVTGNTWTSSGALTRTQGGLTISAGSVALAGVLDQLRITTVNGTDTFDAGTINIMYE